MGWVGDSRAYWFDAVESRQLTVDDSFTEEGIAKGLLTPEQSRLLLAQWAKLQPKDLPPEAADVIRESGRLPLALAMMGAMLREKPRAYWTHVLNLLRKADLGGESANVTIVIRTFASSKAKRPVRRNSRPRYARWFFFFFEHSPLFRIDDVNSAQIA